MSTQEIQPLKTISVLDSTKTEDGMNMQAGVVGAVDIARDVPFDAGAW